MDRETQAGISLSFLSFFVPHLLLQQITKWCNMHLRYCKVKVINLETDLQDGILFAHLLNHVACCKISVNKTPKLRIHKLENVSTVLTYLQKHGMKLIGIKPAGILLLVLFATPIIKYEQILLMEILKQSLVAFGASSYGITFILFI